MHILKVSLPRPRCQAYLGIILRVGSWCLRAAASRQSPMNFALPGHSLLKAEIGKEREGPTHTLDTFGFLEAPADLPRKSMGSFGTSCRTKAPVLHVGKLQT